MDTSPSPRKAAPRGVRLDGDKLLELRRARPWTQLELALEAGVSERTVRKAEAGEPIDIDRAAMIATAFHLEARELLAAPKPEPDAEPDADEAGGAPASPDMPSPTVINRLHLDGSYDDQAAPMIDALLLALRLALDDSRLRVERVTSGSILVWLSMPATCKARFTALHRKGDLARLVQQHCGMPLAGMDWIDDPRAVHRVLADRQTREHLTGTGVGARLWSALATVLELPTQVDLGALAEHFVTRMARLPVGSVPTPAPALRGDTKPAQIIATTYATLHQALDEDDPGVLREMRRDGSLRTHLDALARQHAATQAIAPEAIPGVADAIASALSEALDAADGN